MHINLCIDIGFLGHKSCKHLKFSQRFFSVTVNEAQNISWLNLFFSPLEVFHCVYSQIYFVCMFFFSSNLLSIYFRISRLICDNRPTWVSSSSLANEWMSMSETLNRTITTGNCSSLIFIRSLFHIRSSFFFASRSVFILASQKRITVVD